MPLRSYPGYSDVSFFERAARVLPVIAGTALVGCVIGAFAVFAIDGALTSEPARQRPDARADHQANAASQHATKPVRIIGASIPDPSAGMSEPPPAPQQRSSGPAQPQISSELLSSRPLGPPTQLQRPTAPAVAASQQPRNQPGTSTQIQAPVAAQNAPAAQRPSARLDTLSRAHQNASDAQQQNAPAETDRNEANTTSSATADDQNRTSDPRHSRSRRHTTFSANPWRNGGDDSAALSSRRQDARTDARTYDRNRLYDYYGNRKYGRTREQPYGDAPDARRLRPEPFWGGGNFRGGYGYQSDGD